MMNRTAMSKKLIVLGVDGMDPRLTRHLLDEGKLENIAEFIRRGACRADLRMLGAVPTITPPMWTTLACGAYAGTHGITCFWNQDHQDLASMVYSLDSTLCKAEPIWNCTAEAGYKTLVWHWPGSSWPPTSQSPNLAVVDGTQPGYVNFGNGKKEADFLLTADAQIDTPMYYPAGGTVNTGAGCILEGMDLKDEEGKPAGMNAMAASVGGGGLSNIMLSFADGEGAMEVKPYDVVNTPLREATGWADAPADAKEFVVLLSEGLLRRYALVTKNAQGVYDQVALYRSKNDAEPFVTMQVGKMSPAVLDVTVLPDGSRVQTFRPYKTISINEDGTHLQFWAGQAIEAYNESVWHPKTLCREVFDHVGFYATGAGAGPIQYNCENLKLEANEGYNDWQAAALNYLIADHDYEVIFTHIHNVDGIGHIVWPQGFAHKPEDEEKAQIFRGLMEETYQQTDRYLGKFLHLLDEGWTVMITSDHGLLTETEPEPALMGDPFGVNAKIMSELGFTVLKKDADGKPLKEIDWAKTRAVANRGNHIWINLEGRNATGIVAPEDKYRLEEEIIDALYNYRDPESGRRVIALAMRNKEGELLGFSGPEVGDIVYWLEEGFHRVHGDSLPTQTGYFHTSVSPLFIAAGAGIKAGYTTERVIRQVDMAPTIAALLATRMPAQNEGSVIHQILAEEF